MYNTYTGGCNILNLQMSRHKTIEVKSNNTKTWDYTNPILPMVEPRVSNGTADGVNSIMASNMSQANSLGKNTMIGDHPLLPMPMSMAAAAVAAATGHPAFGNSTSPFLQQHQHASLSQNANVPGGGPGQAQYNPAVAAAAAALAAQSVTGYPMQTLDNRSAVVQVSNFPDQVNCLNLSNSINIF
jgi:hypothetical protein